MGQVTADWILVVLVAVMVVLEMNHEERKLLHKILGLLQEILSILRGEPSAFEIIKIGEDGMPTNNEIQAGSTGTFELTDLLPAGSAFAPGVLPVWAASDTAVTLAAPSGITDGSQISASVPATDANTSFTLGASYTRKSDGVVVTAQVTVTIVPVAPPPPPEPSSFTIQQLS